MKKRISSVLMACLVLVGCFAFSASAASADQFEDVGPENWFYEAVDYVVGEGLFGGTGEKTFSPGEFMTRAMFVTVLGRKSNVNVAQYQNGHFSDVDASSYYAPYINWAAQNGLVGGTGNNRFNPHACITREQIAKILYTYAQKTQNDCSWASEKYQGFSDTNLVSGYAVEGMKWATTHGIIKGTQGRMNPQGRATRAQVAQIFMGAAAVLIHTELLPPVEPTPTPTPTPAPTPRPEPGNTVYWISTGVAYHSRLTCRSLSRTNPAKIRSGTVADAAAAGITRPCANCH